MSVKSLSNEAYEVDSMIFMLQTAQKINSLWSPVCQEQSFKHKPVWF
jgi:hypothetical protein